MSYQHKAVKLAIICMKWEIRVNLTSSFLPVRSNSEDPHHDCVHLIIDGPLWMPEARGHAQRRSASRDISLPFQDDLRPARHFNIPSWALLHIHRGRKVWQADKLHEGHIQTAEWVWGAQGVRALCKGLIVAWWIYDEDMSFILNKKVHQLCGFELRPPFGWVDWICSSVWGGQDSDVWTAHAWGG